MAASRFILLLLVLLETLIPIAYADSCVCDILLSGYFCCADGIYCCPYGYICAGSSCITVAVVVVPVIIVVGIIITVVICVCVRKRRAANNPGVVMQPAGQSAGYPAQPGVYPQGSYPQTGQAYPQTGAYPAGNYPK